MISRRLSRAYTALIMLLFGVQLLGLLPLYATDVQFNFENVLRLANSSVTNRAFRIDAAPKQFSSDGSLLVVPEQFKTNTTTGTIIVSNMVPLDYDCTITLALNGERPFRIRVPDTNVLVNAADIMVVSAVPGQTYTTSVSDGRFVKIVSGVASNLTLKSGTDTNVFLNTNGTAGQILRKGNRGWWADTETPGGSSSGGGSNYLFDVTQFLQPSGGTNIAVKSGALLTNLQVKVSSGRAITVPDAGNGFAAISVTNGGFAVFPSTAGTKLGGISFDGEGDFGFINSSYSASFYADGTGTFAQGQAGYSVGGGFTVPALTNSGVTALQGATTNTGAFNVAGPVTHYGNSTNTGTLRNKGGVTNDVQTVHVGAVENRSSVTNTGPVMNGGNTTNYATVRNIGNVTNVAAVYHEGSVIENSSLTASSLLAIDGSRMHVSATVSAPFSFSGSALSLDILGLTEDTAPDASADLFITYDLSALGIKKAKLLNAFNSGQFSGSSIAIKSGAPLTNIAMAGTWTGTYFYSNGVAGDGTNFFLVNNQALSGNGLWLLAGGLPSSYSIAWGSNAVSSLMRDGRAIISGSDAAFPSLYIVGKQTNTDALDITGPAVHWGNSTNVGTLRNKAGVTNDSNVLTVGAVENRSSVTNTGPVMNGSAVTNFSTTRNIGGVTNDANTVTTGAVENRSSLTNTGIANFAAAVTNWSTLRNKSGVTNDSNVLTAGAVENQSTVTNTGAINNAAASTNWGQSTFMAGGFQKKPLLITSTSLTNQIDFAAQNSYRWTNMVTNIVLQLTNLIEGAELDYYFTGATNGGANYTVYLTVPSPAGVNIHWGGNSPTNGATSFTVTNNLRNTMFTKVWLEFTNGVTTTNLEAYWQFLPK